MEYSCVQLQSTPFSKFYLTRVFKLDARVFKNGRENLSRINFQCQCMHLTTTYGSVNAGSAFCSVDGTDPALPHSSRARLSRNRSMRLFHFASFVLIISSCRTFSILIDSSGSWFLLLDEDEQGVGLSHYLLLLRAIAPQGCFFFVQSASFSKCNDNI